MILNLAKIGPALAGAGGGALKLFNNNSSKKEIIKQTET